ncbi:MAG: DUF1007 family protein [Alphaproteobacteria bacterium]|nr:DUF1007 family protein [Alphaproteobacteria bacterium]
MMFIRRLLTALLAGMLALCAAGDAGAHPHIFINHAMTLLFGADDIAGLRLSWTFDEMYSAVLRKDNVTSPPGEPLSADDVQRLKENAFANLGNYNYFLNLWINGKPMKVETVTDFDASLHDHMITYQFTVPLRSVEPRAVNEIEVVVFDNEYYVEFTLAKEHAVAVEHGDPLGAKCAIYRDVERPSELGPVDSDIVKCSWRRKA